MMERNVSIFTHVAVIDWLIDCCLMPYQQYVRCGQAGWVGVHTTLNLESIYSGVKGELKLLDFNFAFLQINWIIKMNI